jgi:predicted HAD superfamily phosphohydrolase
MHARQVQLSGGANYAYVVPGLVSRSVGCEALRLMVNFKLKAVPGAASTIRGLHESATA